MLKSFYCKRMVMNVDSSNNTINYSNTGGEDFQYYNLDGMIFKILLSSNQTKEKYSCIEILFPAGCEKEIPLHSQSKESVIVCVIQGDFLIRHSEENIEGKEGFVLKIEKNIPRSFKKIGENEGLLLVFYIPGGFENFFREIGTAHIENSKKFGEDDPIMVRLLEKNYGIRIFFE